MASLTGRHQERSYTYQRSTFASATESHRTHIVIIYSINSYLSKITKRLFKNKYRGYANSSDQLASHFYLIVRPKVALIRNARLF